MDDFIEAFRNIISSLLNYFLTSGASEMPAEGATDTGNSSKSRTSDQTSPVQEPIATNVARKRDTVISAIRSNYKTSIYSLTIDQFTMVLFQNRFEPISPFFLAYKYFHTFIMLGALGRSILMKDEEDLVIDWHLFLDHWITVVGSAEALCGVFTVTYFYHHCHTKAMRDSYHLSEGLQIRLLIYAFINSTAITFVCATSAVFWLFIYGKSPTTPFSIEHVVLPALLLMKMNIEMVPFTVDRFMYPLVLLLLYFIDVIVYYYVEYRNLVQAGKQKTYIFIYFNEKSLLHFLWFVLESLLITIAVHVILTLMWHSRWLFVRLCCRRRAHHLHQYLERSSPEVSHPGYALRQDFVDAVPDPSKSACRRCLERIADLERSYRHDFIQPEWKKELRERPSFMYVVYRTGHMVLHFIMLFISLFEPEKPLRNRTVKYFILWPFYFGNFFLCVSFAQALIGFIIISMSYSRKASLRYYEQSELYVTGFQKCYATINGCAVALAVFIFVSRWFLIDDTKHQFSSHDYTYDVPHLANPLSMCLDFIIVGHSYKFIHLVLSSGILAMNVVFNYWLYCSKITGRTGAKFVYEYLNWDEPMTVGIHIAVLYSLLIATHLMLWVVFLCKRSINMVFRRRRLFRQREQKFRNSFENIIATEDPPLVHDLSLTRKTLDSESLTRKSAESRKSQLTSRKSGSTSLGVPSTKNGDGAKILDKST